MQGSLNQQAAYKIKINRLGGGNVSTPYPYFFTH